jgi:hypothetical protein
MDFLKSSKRRSLVSELAYIILNIGLAIGILLTVLAIDSPLPAFGIFLLSKWRTFAVRPRYWFANVQANLVDMIVGLSYVVLLYAAGDALPIQIVLTMLYVGWLLFIKPRSKRIFVAVQAGTAVFLGVTALMTTSYDWYASVVVLVMWLIGYSAARHVLSGYDEAHRSFFSLVWGLVFAEIGWLAYHWTFAYTIPGFGDIKLSQVALVALALSFLAERVYASYRRHEGVRSADVILPLLLTVSVILVIMIFFNTLDRGTV